MKFLDKWLNIIRHCSVDNTYKMTWAKAITEIALEIDYDNAEELYEITLEEIAKRVLRYYWEQTIFFNLIQGSNPLKPPKILSLTKDLIEAYQHRTASKQPIKYYKANIENTVPKQYEYTIKEVIKALKADVSYRFINLEGQKVDGIYNYQRNDSSLFMPKSNLKELKENYLIVFDTINYRYTLILEGFNHSPRIAKKVRIVDIDNISRQSLNKFFAFIEYENPEHICFICGEKITDETPSIDHIIAWSYLYDDNLWNLVFTHKNCNSSKSNILPNDKMIERLEERNKRLLKILRSKSINNKYNFELENAIENDLVKKFWISCQG